MRKSTRKLKAKETLEIINSGNFRTANGELVDIKHDIETMLLETAFYSSEILERLNHKEKSQKNFETRFEVAEEDTVSCVLRLNKMHHENIMCLNFASAKNPGGGFLNGALAQEESLAVSSALYGSQMEAFEFYETHREMKSCVYTDGMIYSPNVPFFRNNKGELLNPIAYANVITSAAVNTGVVKRKEAHLTPMISELMEKRIEKLLNLSLEQGNTTLILGAWGCGVFQNDPQRIARLFYKALQGPFKNQFKHVVFAIYSRNERFLKAFQETFYNEIVRID